MALTMSVYSLTQNIGYIANIMQDIAIMMGVSMVLSSIFHYHRYGQTRGSAMSMQQYSAAKPTLILLGGVLLICIPTTLSTALLAVWSDSSPLSYGAGASDWEDLVPAVIMFVRIIGVGSFIRGCVLVSRAHGEQSQPGAMGKAVLHLLSGITCTNILGTLTLFKHILGFV